MESWKIGKMESWKDGKRNDGRMGRWKDGILEGGTGRLYDNATGRPGEGLSIESLKSRGEVEGNYFLVVRMPLIFIILESLRIFR